MNAERSVLILYVLRFHVRCFGLLVLFAMASGCGQPNSGEPAASPAAGPNQPRRESNRAAPGRTVTNYPIEGVVKRVEKEFEHVRIAHEAIPGFMDAMEMRFPYPDKTALETLRPGDRVSGTLRVFKENGVVTDYALLGLTVTEPAPPPRMVLDTSRGKVQVREAPKRLTPLDSVPDFTMTLQDGKALKLSSLQGNVVVLTFIYTRCPLPDFCPLMDKKFSDLAQRIQASAAHARSVRLISLSFDPDHDTPEVLSRHAQIHGARPPLWTYAVASHDELAKIGPPLGLFYAPGKKEIAHNLCTVVIDRHGKLARLEVGTAHNKWTTADILKTIDSLIPAAQN